MSDKIPTFPPLLKGHQATLDQDPMQWACARATNGELGAGDLVWSSQTENLRFAIVLEPEVPRQRCGEIVYVAMVAFADAAGAVIPPEVAITYQWPNIIQMNDGQIGTVELVVSDEDADDIPLWMVLQLNIQMVPDFADMNPGEKYHITTFWDEGCGHVTSMDLLESTSRHLVNAIHNWTEDGFKPVHQQWTGRLNKNEQFPQGLFAEDVQFLGIDETGNGLLKMEGATVSKPVIEHLEGLHAARPVTV